MKTLTLSKDRFDPLFARYGIAPDEVPSAEWVRSIRAQRWSLAKAFLKKKAAIAFGRNGRNGQSEILRAYDAQWKKKAFVRYSPSQSRGGAPWIWQNLKWLMSNEAGAAIRLLFLDDVLGRLKAATALEVGAGNGINLMMLSARYPQIQFFGLEPTQGGFDTAMLAIESGQLPEPLADFSPFALTDLSGPSRIKMTRGSAASLPYEDASVDIVFTSLALEQMEEIRNDALREISRVAKEWVVMLEPFKDVNTSGDKRLYVRTYDYFQGSIAELEKYGLEVEEVYADMPHKAMLGTALVVARRVR